MNYWGTDTGPSVGMNLAEEKGLTRVQTLGMRRLRSERSGGTQSGPPLGLFVLYHKCVSRLKPSCGGWARCAEPGFPNTADECARPPGSASAFRCCAAIWDAAAVAIDPNRSLGTFHPNAIRIVTVWCKMIATIRALRVVSGPLSTIHDSKLHLALTAPGTV